MSPTEPVATPGRSGPWNAAGTLMSGMLVYGFLGWLADQWLGTSFLVAVGVVTGAVLGTYLMVLNLRPGPPPPPDAT